MKSMPFRLILFGVLLQALVLAPNAMADAAKARAIIAKAIKAVGGEKKLAQCNAMTWKEKGTYYGMGDGLPYTGVYAMQWPDQFRMEIEGVFTIVVNGKQGWIQMAGETKEMTAEQLAEQKESLYGGYVSSLLPLKDKAFTLDTLPDAEVGGKPAVGVKVASKGHRDVQLFFDKKSGLLVKSAFRMKSAELKGKVVLMENSFSDYQAVNGVKVPMKMAMKRDGKRFVESQNVEVKPVGKLPAETFGKP